MSGSPDIYYVAWWVMALLFIVPFLVVASRKKLFRAFSYPTLAATLSNMAVMYGIMCVVAVVVMAGSSALGESFVWYREILRNGGGVFIMALYLFVVCTIAFFYPGLLLLTVLYYLSRKWESSN